MSIDNNILDNESTMLDSANNYVQPDDSTVYNNESDEARRSEEADKHDYTWQKVAIGGFVGMALGATASCIGTAAAGNIESTDAADAKDAEVGNGNPLIDDSVGIANGVSDDMTFSQAFSTARAEVGPGGVFIWHDRIFNTYTAEEWDGMSLAERQAYSDNFVWNHGSASSHGQHNDSDATQTVVQTQTISDSNAPIENVATPDNNGEIEVMGVDTAPEVAVLGVVHDSESGMNYGGMLIDGKEVVLVDVDGDLMFDIAGADINNDGHISEDEVAIIDQPITTEDLGGFINGNDDPGYAMDDTDAIDGLALI